MQIFIPVVREITTLVMGQIAEIKKAVKAVVMVGGFGQNGFLRESLRLVLGSRVEIIQSPCAYVVYASPMHFVTQPDESRQLESCYPWSINERLGWSIDGPRTSFNWLPIGTQTLRFR